MTPTSINLDALEKLDALDSLPPAGKPVLLPLDLVHEDPDQPRKTFNDEKMRELSASVAQSGIRVPVSVRPHPTLPGEYMLNFGARRRRAAIAAGFSEIPALIDDLLTDFDQVIENLQRADLTPMELALFVVDKMRGGMKPAAIAERLGLARSAVSKFLALIDAPADIEAVYTSGRTTSPETIYELRLIHSRWPAETTKWLGSDVEVTRRTVEAFKKGLEGMAEAKKQNAVPINDPLLIRRPSVVVHIGERLANLVLDRLGAGDGEVLVRWHDGDCEIEAVAASDIQVVRVTEAAREKRLAKRIGRERRR